jgi:hypothetical protein
MTNATFRPVTGGCQCGAVRYALHMPPERTHYCHCRMCQRAVGNVFAALAGCRKQQFEWTQGTPGFFASSSMARRGFCPNCGTPLSFAYEDSKWIYLTVGSLDDPSQAIPTIHYGIESQVHWLRIEDALPREETAVNEKLAQMTVFQYGGSAAHG